MATIKYSDLASFPSNRIVLDTEVCEELCKCPFDPSISVFVAMNDGTINCPNAILNDVALHVKWARDHWDIPENQIPYEEELSHWNIIHAHYLTLHSLTSSIIDRNPAVLKLIDDLKEELLKLAVTGSDSLEEKYQRVKARLGGNADFQQRYGGASASGKLDQAARLEANQNAQKVNILRLWQETLANSGDTYMTVYNGMPDRRGQEIRNRDIVSIKYALNEVLEWMITMINQDTRVKMDVSLFDGKVNKRKNMLNEEDQSECSRRFTTVVLKNIGSYREIAKAQYRATKIIELIDDMYNKAKLENEEVEQVASASDARQNRDERQQWMEEHHPEAMQVPTLVEVPPTPSSTSGSIYSRDLPIFGALPPAGVSGRYDSEDQARRRRAEQRAASGGRQGRSSRHALAVAPHQNSAFLSPNSAKTPKPAKKTQQLRRSSLSVSAESQNAYRQANRGSGSSSEAPNPSSFSSRYLRDSSADQLAPESTTPETQYPYSPNDYYRGVGSRRGERQ